MGRSKTLALLLLEFVVLVVLQRACCTARLEPAGNVHFEPSVQDLPAVVPKAGNVTEGEQATLDGQCLTLSPMYK